MDIKHYFDSEILRFDEVCLHALLIFSTRASGDKFDMQISYEMVSNAHVQQLTVSL